MIAGQSSCGSQGLRVAMLTTVGDACGIAAYSRPLVKSLRELADVVVEPIQPGKQPLAHYREQAERLNAADLIHIQHEHSFWGGVLPNHSAFWNLRYLLQKPVVVTAHTTTSLRKLLKLPTERRLPQRIAKEILVRRRGYRDSVEIAPFVTGRCIVHTKEGGQALVDRGANAKHIHVIPAGVPATVPAPTAGAAFRERFGLRGRRIVSLFGYIAPNKGYELALGVLPLLPSDVTLVIAGGVRNAEMEPYMQRLRPLLDRAGSNRVVVTGFLSESDVAEAMAASEVVVAPHTIATGSYSVMVPIAYGRPIVASNLACFAEIAERNPCLELFRASDPDDFARALNLVLSNHEKRNELARLTREYSSSHSWRQVAQETLGVYYEAIADVERLSHH